MDSSLISPWHSLSHVQPPSVPVLVALTVRGYQLVPRFCPTFAVSELYFHANSSSRSISLLTLLIDLPDNCNIFSNVQVNNQGNNLVVNGICSNVQTFFNARSLSSNGLSLTWDPNNQDARRDFSCSIPRSMGTSYCAVNNVNWAVQLGISTGISLTSCDEFPIASSEEGGSFFPTLPQNPTGVSTSCVPVWQQSLQGNCHSE